MRNDEFLFNNDVRKLDGENFAKAFFLILLSMFIGSYVSTFLNQFLKWYTGYYTNKGRQVFFRAPTIFILIYQ